MTQDDPDLDAAYALQTPEDSVRLYRDWAETYDSAFIDEMDYRLPAHVARVFLEAEPQGPVLDLGAGTGVMGALLAGRVAPVDGTDISREMLEVAARKGVYRRLFEGDLTQRLDVADGSYQSVVSSGTFTTGHVGPDALDEVLRLLAPGGLAAISVNAKHWQGAGFADAFDRMAPNLAALERTEVPIYGPRATGPHATDTGFVLLFRKA
ncbi:class I SAM-dependent DNA methyltransferase [Marimonas lutisalis]|uniref:class I SAM-dependent DNA methyltransferase n=1 Tax=Marimonas lutisalis TaxID=2545756 RepID=UPI0010F58E94|nr:methyltransferase domain-containing protein [Marimonas lutisalis]